MHLMKITGQSSKTDALSTNGSTDYSQQM